MKNKRQKRILTLIAAVMLCIAAFPLTAYAGGAPATEKTEETPVVETTPEPVATPNPFTPAGTGTVIDNATDTDGKEFYTIATPDENVFYLIIDKQRGTENVYFLGAVPEKDLLALAEKSGDNSQTATPVTPEPTPEPAPDPEPEPEPEKGGNMGMMIFIVIVALAGGGAAYYFKIYRPKQGQTETGEDFDEYETDDRDIYAEETEDDSQPWDIGAEDESNGDDEA